MRLCTRPGRGSAWWSVAGGDFLPVTAVLLCPWAFNDPALAGASSLGAVVAAASRSGAVAACLLESGPASCALDGGVGGGGGGGGCVSSWTSGLGWGFGEDLTGGGAGSLAGCKRTSGRSLLARPCGRSLRRTGVRSRRAVGDWPPLSRARTAGLFRWRSRDGGGGDVRGFVPFAAPAAAAADPRVRVLAVSRGDEVATSCVLFRPGSGLPRGVAAPTAAAWPASVESAAAGFGGAGAGALSPAGSDADASTCRGGGAGSSSSLSSDE